MIIIKVMGGLGNQLQQYALYEKFRSLGIPAKLDISWYRSRRKVFMPRALELDYFEGLHYECCTEEEKEVLWGRENAAADRLKRKFLKNRLQWFTENERIYLPEIFSFRDSYLEGYWACEKYYHDIMPLLREKVRFPESAEEKNRILDDPERAGNAISIHIRRGDYLLSENADIFAGICTEQYYQSAVDFMKSKNAEAHFYVFSDDVSYARETYRGDEYTIVDWNTGTDSFYDMLLMSRCAHHICANSTFSFWGARLNPNEAKTVIRPLQYLRNQEADPAVIRELWEGYTLIDAEGNLR